MHDIFVVANLFVKI